MVVMAWRASLSEPGSVPAHRRRSFAPTRQHDGPGYRTAFAIAFTRSVVAQAPSVVQSERTKVGRRSMPHAGPGLGDRHDRDERGRSVYSGAPGAMIDEA